jgi:hypothetical protein
VTSKGDSDRTPLGCPLPIVNKCPLSDSDSPYRTMRLLFGLFK